MQELRRASASSVMSSSEASALRSALECIDAEDAGTKNAEWVEFEVSCEQLNFLFIPIAIFDEGVKAVNELNAGTAVQGHILAPLNLSESVLHPGCHEFPFHLFMVVHPSPAHAKLI